MIYLSLYYINESNIKNQTLDIRKKTIKNTNVSKILGKSIKFCLIEKTYSVLTLASAVDPDGAVKVNKSTYDGKQTF
jgi:hypothetical protein